MSTCSLLGACRYGKGEQVFLCYGKYTNLELLGKASPAVHVLIAVSLLVQHTA